MEPRLVFEEIERKNLSPFACLSTESKGRLRHEEKCPVRTDFQRDRDRIIHSKAFRRLKHKTQVFLAPEGDHYRTRLTHTLEVSQIARTIARALRLNEDLTEAISLGHDLGHTPFGHAGERALNDLFSKGFNHYEQSLRVVDVLAKGGHGLNLTYETRNGILCHTKGREADTMEGRIVRVADRIAYMNHDIDDAIRAGVLSSGDIPKRITDVLGNTTTSRINTMVISVISNTHDDVLQMSEEVAEVFDELHSFMFESVYCNDYAKHEEKKVPALISMLYDHFLTHPENLPPKLQVISETEGIERAVCDHISGMTDQYAIDKFKEIYIPVAWSGGGKMPLPILRGQINQL